MSYKGRIKPKNDSSLHSDKPLRPLMDPRAGSIKRKPNKNTTLIEEMKAWKYRKLHKYQTMSSTPKTGVRVTHNAKNSENQTNPSTGHKRGMSSNEPSRRLESANLYNHNQSSIPVSSKETSGKQKRATTSLAKIRGNKRYFEDPNDQTVPNNFSDNEIEETIDIVEDSRIIVKAKPKRRRKQTVNMRSHTAIKDMPYSIDKSFYAHPLSEKAHHKNRMSLDHLTFNQIKLERIKQERKIDTVQKKLKILKHNHEYIDNRLDFKYGYYHYLTLFCIELGPVCPLSTLKSY